MKTSKRCNVTPYGPEAPLTKEYNRLYKSIFSNPDKYKAVVKALSFSKKGISGKSGWTSVIVCRG